MPSNAQAPRAPWRGFAAVAVLGTALRLALTWSGWTDNLVLADDAFYYFTIARNIAAGYGSTFDGLAPTNGYHPLWLLILTPIYTLAGALHASPWLGIRLALTLCALFDLVSAWLLYRLLVRLGHPHGALWASALWLLFPGSVLATLRGLEGSLNAMLFMLNAWLVVRIFERGHLTLKAGASLGAVVGLAFLARTDNGVLMPLVVAAEIAVFAGRDRARWSKVPGFLLACAAIAALLALPWFAWNLHTFGTPWQVSGVMRFNNPRIGGHIGEAMAAHHLPGLAVRVVALGSFLWRPIQFALGERDQWPLVILLSALAAGALALLLPPLARNLRRGASQAERALAAGCAAFLLGHMTLYALVLGFYANWYTCVPTLAVLLLVVGLGADVPLGAVPPAWRAMLAAVLGIAGVAMFARFFEVSGIRPRGWELVARGDFMTIAREAPGARTIGYQSAGVAGYFGPGFGAYRVVNLDGLVNNEICKAWLAGHYFEYLDRTVDMVCISGPEGFDYLLGPGGRPRFAARFPRWSESSGFYGPRPGPARR